jgi:NADH/NAD ratio-sensing transcriptional regulator Rex
MNTPSKSETFPLQLWICSECGLGQVEDVTTPDRLFRDYRYMSSISKTFLSHASGFANRMIMELDWKQGDWVLEIASNDGYMLKNFVDHDIEVVGVEPALNIAEIAIKKGIKTIPEFFDIKLAKQILSEYGSPRLIIANNVYAHVPDIRNFTEGLSLLMNQRTLLSIENPSIINLLESLQFDSIYHEHYSYLSVHSVSRLMKCFGINLFNVEQINTHGGSNRYWLSKGDLQPLPSVDEIGRQEVNFGLLDESKWSEFSKSVDKIINDFSKFVSNANARGEKIAGYGAAAKASTLINAAKIQCGDIQFIVDKSPEKIGRFMPQVGIPIVKDDILKESDIDHLVVFPWNIIHEIRESFFGELRSELKIWCAIPKLREVI